MVRSCIDRKITKRKRQQNEIKHKCITTNCTTRQQDMSVIMLRTFFFFFNQSLIAAFLEKIGKKSKLLRNINTQPLLISTTIRWQSYWQKECLESTLSMLYQIFLDLCDMCETGNKCLWEFKNSIFFLLRFITQKMCTENITWRLTLQLSLLSTLGAHLLLNVECFESDWKPCIA